MFKTNLKYMLLASLGSMEIVLILLVLAMVWVLGYYGRETRIGFGGAVLLGVLLTPLVAFIIISFLRPARLRKHTKFI